MHYELRIPMQQAVRLAFDPMIKMHGMEFNYALSLMTEAFMVKYHMFPTNFNTCQHTQIIMGEDMVIRFTKEGVTTRKLLPGELGYV